MQDDAALIALDAVTKTYRIGEERVVGVHDMTLSIGAGELVVIMGPSGSGKSTLLHLVGCLDRPTTGSYRLAGRDVHGLCDDALARVRNRSIGFVFQSFQLMPRASAVENVELPLVYAGVSPAERRARAERALAQVGLAHRARHSPGRMSGGEQQRVAIARAIVTAPRIVLADEPTGNLDSSTGAQVMSLLEALARQGITVVVVTHDAGLCRYATRVLRIRDGRLVHDSAWPARCAAE